MRFHTKRDTYWYKRYESFKNFYTFRSLAFVLDTLIQKGNKLPTSSPQLIPNIRKEKLRQHVSNILLVYNPVTEFISL